MPERPAKAVYDVLSAAGSLSGETIRIGYPESAPDRGVWCIDATAGPTIPEQGSGEKMLQPRVQVFVRAKTRDLESGTTLAWAVHDALYDGLPTDYTRSVPLTSPIQLQPDELDRPRWSINCEMTLIE